MKNLKFNQLVFLMLLFFASFQAKANENGKETEGEVPQAQNSVEDRVETLLDSLSEEDLDTLIDKAKSIGGEEGLAALAELWNTEATPLRFKIIYAMSEVIRDGDFDLIELANRRDLMVRCAVAISARFLGEDAGLSILEKLAQDTNSWVRGTVAISARFLGEDAGLSILEKLAQDTDSWVRSMVANSAGFLGEDAGLELLFIFKKLFQDTESPVRKAVAILEKLSQDTDSLVRREVAKSAGFLGEDAGLSILEKLAQDTDSWVRVAVAISAGTIGGDAGLSILEKLAQDTNTDVREAIIRAAKKIKREE